MCKNIKVLSKDSCTLKFARFDRVYTQTTNDAEEIRRKKGVTVMSLISDITRDIEF